MKLIIIRVAFNITSKSLYSTFPIEVTDARAAKQLPLRLNYLLITQEHVGIRVIAKGADTAAFSWPRFHDATHGNDEVMKPARDCLRLRN